MHRPIPPLSFLLAASFALHAMFAVDYEQGWSRVATPIFLLGFSGACWGVFAKFRWVWSTVLCIGLTYPVINLLFPPGGADFQPHPTVVPWLIWIEVALSVLLAFLMLWPRSREAYFQPKS